MAPIKIKFNFNYQEIPIFNNILEIRGTKNAHKS
jgi:hypothetical protein